MNIDFRHLKAAFNKALEWGYIKKNPFSFVKLLKLPQKTPRFIQEKEMNKIPDYLQKRSPNFHDFVLLTLETGCRRSQMLFLTDEDMDLKNGFIRIRGKGNKERIIPLTGEAKELLTKHMKQGRIFPYWTAGWVSKKWKQVVKELGFPYRFHDIRHTTASWLAIKGVPIKIIQELLGHTNITQIHAHLRPDVIRDALEQVFGKAGKSQAVPALKLVK